MASFYSSTHGITWILSFFLMLLVSLLGGIMYAGLIRLFSIPFKGKGTFESQFALYSFIYPVYFILLHIIKFFYFLFTKESLGGYVLVAFAIVAYIWMLFSVKIEQEINWIPAIGVSLITTAIVAFFSMTYIR